MARLLVDQFKDPPIAQQVVFDDFAVHYCLSDEASAFEKLQ
jgi:hypothetical protein